MTSLREIFAKNLRENRKRCGLSQEKLAEKADVSAHYIAVIELAKNFPAADVIERLAKALGIDIYELFVSAPSIDDDLENNRQVLFDGIRQIVEEAVDKTFAKQEWKGKTDRLGRKTDCSYRDKGT
jgi:transcriptional regulator with XRE-family HTH domain